MFDVADDADDLTRHFWDVAQTLNSQSPADRVLIRKQTTSQQLVDHHHARHLLRVTLTQESSLEQGDAHRLQVTRAHRVEKRPRRLFGRWPRPAANPEWHLPVAVTQRDDGCHRSFLHAGRSTDALEQLLIKEPHL